MEIKLTGQRDYQVLSKVFSRSVLLELAKGQRSSSLGKILSELGLHCHDVIDEISLVDFFDDSYDLLLKNYRNEYIFKNAIASKIVKGKHRLANSSYFTEFKIGNSIADVVVFNGTSTAYEIKTEYDSFERLDGQMLSYSKVFDKIFLVVPPSKVKKALELSPAHVGVYELKDSYSLSVVKDAKSNLNNLCPIEIFNCLNKSEYLEIISKSYDYTPPKSPSLLKNECLKLFSLLEIRKIHNLFVESLKKRQLDAVEKEIIKSLPDSLTSLTLSARLNKKLLANFYSCIKSTQENNMKRKCHVSLISSRKTI